MVFELKNPPTVANFKPSAAITCTLKSVVTMAIGPHAWRRPAKSVQLSFRQTRRMTAQLCRQVASLFQRRFPTTPILPFRTHSDFPAITLRGLQ